MSVTDDVLEDYLGTYPDLTRDQIEQVLSTLASTTTAEGGMRTAIAAAIGDVLPGTAERIGSYSDSDATDYLRILKGALIFTLECWPAPSDEGRPPTDRIEAMVRNVQ